MPLSRSGLRPRPKPRQLKSRVRQARASLARSSPKPTPQAAPQIPLLTLAPLPSYKPINAAKVIMARHHLISAKARQDPRDKLYLPRKPFTAGPSPLALYRKDADACNAGTTYKTGNNMGIRLF
ncbi:hypothetical protein F4861DRAFT_536145 [Xylaria intraflava]|nr:hypothetical protein F4861DRAFT_536145 [Xylaria intraflava]